jgi:LysM repeat protein
MSRETKIGMLTGLLVIVLIGVLLSEYLGNSGPEGKGKVAAMNTGDGARKSIREPVMAPGQEREPIINAMVSGPNDGQPEVPQSVAGGNGGTVVTPPAEVTDVGHARDVAAGKTSVDLTGKMPDGTNLATYVTPEEEKRALEMQKLAGVGAPGGNLATVPLPPPTTKTEVYVVAKGDTLTTIAKKYYKSATKAEFAKIVAANPGVLKDDKTPLVVGKKLNIVVPVVASVVPPVAPGMSLKTGPGVGMPGPVTGLKTGDVAPTAKIYEVQKGDTIERIARKVSPGTLTATVKAIMTLNNLKADSVLQVGQKLKMPEVAAAPGPIPAVATVH